MMNKVPYIRKRYECYMNMHKMIMYVDINIEEQKYMYVHTSIYNLKTYLNLNTDIRVFVIF